MDFNVKTQGGGDFAVELMEAKKNGMGERISRKRIAKSPWQAAILTLVGCPIEAVRPSKKKRREQREKELYRWHRAEQARAQQAVQRQCEELIQRFQEKMK
ncbi:hypothetical protein A2118_01260 [Candidatus Kaiserbacteria bacterium GWA2_50_9]|uniref:Uncharacterized protein n=1 Tax=Candidatus Kaiserbacteria bacterium GWA2_50_9 TaxID=1798474 RepID=A0A1F6BTT7_9BACT|nr:MAG: hypothetical protein A2118_01260 [Candidatus Kaiserbacteria bacterium GWA2_50_9]